MTQLTVLHLSDLHWAPQNGADLGIVRDALLRDLAVCKADHDLQPNMIVFSGDLALGGDNAEWFKKAYEEFLIPVSKAVNLTLSHVFVVPGNHDISREHVRKIPFIQKGLQQRLVSEGEVNCFIDKQHASGSEEAQSLARMQSFYDVHDVYHPDQEGLSVFHRTAKLDVEGRRIGVACFNSAWMATGEADDVDFRRLLIGERAVDDALDKLSDCELRIAIHHHPLDWLTPFDNDATDLLLRRSFDLSCTGHIHQAKPMMSIDASGACVMSQTGSVFAGREWFNGYQFIRIDLLGRQFEFFVREYINRRREFDKAVRVSADGHVSLRVDSGRDRSRSDKVQLFLRGTRESVRGKLERQLSLAGGDTEEIRNFRVEAFVAPPLMLGSGNSIEEGPSEDLSLRLDDLLTRDDNCVVLGSRHSGKTTLAHYMLYKMAFEPSGNDQIPVYVDTRDFKFNEYGIGRQLQNFYGSSPPRSEIKQHCKDGIFTFLFDNCDASEQVLERIASFAKEQAACRIIVLSTPNYDAVSPDRMFNEHLTDFTKVHIRALNRGRIRAISRQWSSSMSEGQEIYELVINQLVRDGLPRTPYMVSLLIWALKQKRDLTKINEALLLQSMLDHLLGKADFRLAKRGVLNPLGKEITLQNLARFFRENGSVVDENDVTTFLIAFFKRKRLPFIGGDVLEKLVDCGILRRTSDNIAFRYEAFQEYFYAKLMLSDRSELEAHLSGLNFLGVRREIELLSGLKQENDDIISAIEQALDSRVPERFEKCCPSGFDAIAASELDIGTTKAELGEIRRTRLSTEQLDEMLDEADRRALARGDRGVRESLKRADGNVVSAAEEREAEGIAADRKSPSTPIRPSTHMAAIDLLARVIRNSDFTDYDRKGPATKRVLESWTKIFLLIMEEIEEIMSAVGREDGNVIPESEFKSMKYLISKFMFNAVASGVIKHISSPTMSATLHSLVEEGGFTTGEHLLTLFLLEDIDDESWEEMWAAEIEDPGKSGFVIDCFVQRLLALTYSKALDAKQEKRVEVLVDRIEKRLGWSNEKKAEVIQQIQSARDLRALEQMKLS